MLGRSMTRFLSLVTQAGSLRQARKPTVCVTSGADYTCAGFNVDALKLNSGRTLTRRNNLMGYLTPRFEYCSVNY